MIPKKVTFHLHLLMFKIILKGGKKLKEGWDLTIILKSDLEIELGQVSGHDSSNLTQVNSNFCFLKIKNDFILEKKLTGFDWVFSWLTESQINRDPYFY